MTINTGIRRRLRPRLLIVAAGIAFAVLTGLRVWSWDRHDGWWYLGLSGFYLVMVVGLAVVNVVLSLRRRPMAGFVVTPGGFAVRPAVPPELMAVLLMSLLGMQAEILVGLWRAVASAEPGRLAMDVAFASVTTILIVVGAAVTAAAVRFAWHGSGVELTPAGVSWRTPVHRRLIPWQALAPGGPSLPQRSPRRLQLIVEQPELVQRGWDVLGGTRQRPMLPLDPHAWFLPGAIRWYVEHPTDRAAIGTPVEHDRLLAELAAAAHRPSAAQPESPSTTTPSTTTPSTATPSTTTPSTTTPDATATEGRRPRPIGTALRLAYVAVAVALVTAAANVVVTIVLRDNLLAAEAAIAATRPSLPPEEAGGTLILDTDTLAFARGWAAGVLICTSLVAIVAIALARAVARGSNGARVGLAILSGAAAILVLCPFLWPAASLTAEPAAGSLLNIWSAVQVLEGFGLAALALAVLALLLSPGVVAYSHRSAP